MSANNIKGLIAIFLLVVLANLLGFSSSFRRQRDTQRILDFGALAGGLIKYYGEFGHYPDSDKEGRIVACPGPLTGLERDESGKIINNGFKKAKLTNLIPCEWGKDALLDAADVHYPAYLSLIPADPQAKKGASYFYFSNGKEFQIYGSLETQEPEDYSKAIRKRGLKCGSRICNFGRSSGVPLDKPLE